MGWKISAVKTLLYRDNVPRHKYKYNVDLAVLTNSYLSYVLSKCRIN